MNKNLQRRLSVFAIMSVAIALPLAVSGMWLMKLTPYHPTFISIAGWFIAAPAGLVASTLGGVPYGVAWAVGLLAEAIVAFLPLAGWAFLTRNRIPVSKSRSTRIVTTVILLLANILLAFVLIGYLEEMQPPLAVPKTFLPGEFASAKSKLPHGVSVDFDQLAFARGKLYVASVVGLIEVEGAKVSAIYRWHVISRVDGVWSGPRGQSLWLQQSVSHDLTNLSDSGWRNITLPTPTRGYTRGDMLEGIKVATVGSDLWLSGGSTVWKWKPGTLNWETVSVPGMSTTYDSVEVYGAGEQPMVLRGANQLFGSAKDAVLLKRAVDGSWLETKLDECCVKDLISLGDDVYFRNGKGALIRVTNGKSETIAAPGRVEAMAADGGRLIVSIANVGIYSFANEWKKLFDVPYPPTLEQPWVHLAANDDVIALSVTQSSSSAQTPGGDGLWITAGSKMVRIEIPD